MESFHLVEIDPDPYSRGDGRRVEFLNLILIFTAGYLVWRRPEREPLAFGLLVASALLTAALFLIGTRTSNPAADELLNFVRTVSLQPTGDSLQPGKCISARFVVRRTSLLV